MEQLSFYAALIVEISLILLGLYFGYRSFKTNREGEYSGRRGARSALLFAVGLMLVTLGFSLIVMTTDRTRIDEYLAALIILEMIFGLIVFLVYFSGQFILTKILAIFKKPKS